MTTETLQAIYVRGKNFRRLAWCVAFLFVAYIYLVNSVVFNLVARQKALNELATRQTAVISLETHYLSLAASITLDLAHQLSFNDAEGNTVFIKSVTPPVAVALLSASR